MSENVPAPDPSVLTTEALRREVQHLKELTLQRIEGVDQRLSEKLDADIRALYAEITNREHSVELALRSAQTAVDKAETATDKRFDSVNEFRAQLTEQAGQFVPREVFETAITNLSARVDRNTDSINLSGGMGAGSAAEREQTNKNNLRIVQIIGVGVSFVALLVVIANILTAKGG